MNAEVEVWEAHNSATAMAWEQVRSLKRFDEPGFDVAGAFFQVYEPIYKGFLDRFARIGGLAMAIAPDWYKILENYIGEDDAIEVTEEDEDPLNQRNGVITIEITRAEPPEATIEVKVEPVPENYDEDVPF